LGATWYEVDVSIALAILRERENVREAITIEVVAKPPDV